MRGWGVAFAVGLLVVSTAEASHAAVLRYRGTFSFHLRTYSPIPVTGSGVATVNGSGGAGHLTALHLDSGIRATDTIVVPLTDPAVTAMSILSLRATQVTFGGSFPVTFQDPGGGTDILTDPGGGGGILPVQGKVLVCIVTAGCGASLQVPLTQSGTRGVGIGAGLLTVSGFAQAGLRVSVNGNPWTVNTATITGIPIGNGLSTISTRKGFVHGPASGTESTTALPSGVLQLVTPVFVTTSLEGREAMPTFGTVRLHFLVPEPGSLLLLGSGVAGLALIGRRKLRR